MDLLDVSFDVSFDQCMYGLTDPASGACYKKPTTVVGNVPSLGLLSQACDHSHAHEQVIGKVCVDHVWISRSKIAGAYPKCLCQKWARIVVGDLQSCNTYKRRRLAQANNA